MLYSRESGGSVTSDFVVVSILYPTDIYCVFSNKFNWGLSQELVMNHEAYYPDKAPKIDTLLDALGHHLRREIIYYFENCTESETATFQEVLTHIHDRLPDTMHEQLEVKLAHNHLPKLADRGWLEYDPRTKQIRYFGHESAASLIRELPVLFGPNAGQSTGE